MDWKRVQSGIFVAVEILVVITAPILAIVLILWHRYGGLTPDKLAAWTVALLGLLAIAGVFERYKHFRKVETGIERLNTVISEQSSSGNVAFFPDRVHAPSFLDLAAQAKQDILLVMLAPAYIIYYQRDLIDTLSRRGVSIRFLLPNPGNGQDVDPIIPRIATSGKHEHFASVLREIITNLQSFRQGLPDQFRGNVHIRLYDCAVPSLNVTVVDSATARGAVLVELLPFKFERGERPSLLIRAEAHKESLYENFVKNYNELWEMGSPV